MPPKRPREPAPEPDGLAIDIDPELLEAAVAAVDRRLRHREDDTDVEVEVDLASAPPQPASPVRDARPDEQALLRVRLREAEERTRGLERELLELTRRHDESESQLREVRKAAREAQSDFDRVRGRSAKDREEAERIAEERLLRQILDTSDNLERAWQHAMSDPSSLLGGLQMIVEQFRGVLRRLGVERIDATTGVSFDPEIHEAVMYVTSARVEPGAVVDEVAPGYRLRGRLFRPARVTVASPA